MPGYRSTPPATWLRILLCLLPLIEWNCNPKPSPEKWWQSELLPAQSVPSAVRIEHLNCWVESERFYVTGVCSNQSASWRQIWLQLAPAAASKRLQINGCAGAVVPLFSKAVAPQGRSAFFAGWPLTDLEGVPDTCLLVQARGLDKGSGPILLVEGLSGVKMLHPPMPGQSVGEEFAWQIQAVLNNPLPQVARHPRLELMLFGSDQRLWYSTLLNPEDPTIGQVLQMDKSGALQPGEKHSFGLMAYYERLPEALRKGKIGRVEMLAFEDR